MNPVDHLEADGSAAREKGAAIHGEKIYARARKIIDKGITAGSSKHRIQRIDLEKDAYAVIAKPLQWLAAPRKFSGQE